MVFFDDFGSFILVLAVIGFLVKDAFYSPRRWLFHEPYDYKDSTEKIYSNVSFAVLLVCVAWMLFAWYVQWNQTQFENFLISLGDVLQKMIDSGALTDNSVLESSKQILRGMFLLGFFTAVYFIAFIMIATAGIYYELMDRKAISITLNTNQVKVIYRRILFESSDFIYLQNKDDLKRWVAIKKEDISIIESTVTDSRLQTSVSSFCTWLKKKKTKPQ